MNTISFHNKQCDKKCDKKCDKNVIKNVKIIVQYHHITKILMIIVNIIHQNLYVKGQ